MKKLSLISFAIYALSTPLSAAEVDHYSLHYGAIEDATLEINERANIYLRRAVNAANEQASCDEAILYQELRVYFANHSQGELGADLLHDKSIPRSIIPLADSVYQDWSVLNGLLLGIPSAKKSPLALGPILKMGEVVVGTDKFEHMFGMGFQYFKGHYLQGKALHKILKRGISLEKTALGGNIFATGVFSYADLSANFNGMRFWNHMLLEHEDVLGAQYNLGPYVRCENGAYVVAGKIDFRNYMDLSMDESFNCSKFATRKGLKKFTSRLKQRRSEQTCLGPKDHKALQNKYHVPISSDPKKRTIGHWILNTKGHAKVSYFNEF